MFIARMFGTIILSLFPIVVKEIGVSGCMWIFCAMCILGVIFVHSIMLETEGKSIFEIQEILKAKRIKN